MTDPQVRAEAAVVPGRFPVGWAAACAGLGLGLAWVYWPTLQHLQSRWAREPQYSHGFLVPLFALAVLWLRKERWSPRRLRPSWWGLPLLLAAAALRAVGAYFYLDGLDGLSLLPALLGASLLVGGWPCCRWAAPAVGLLVFMLPLPFQAEVALAGPLQSLATLAATYTIQALGLPAVSEGNVILIDDYRIGVLEACSGLGMLSAFFAISATVALVIRRPRLDRAVIFLSAIPIGVLVNLVRISATGLVYGAFGSRAAHGFFHDLAGWFMMPLALALLGLELWWLNRLFVDRPETGPVPVFLDPKSHAGAKPPAVHP